MATRKKRSADAVAATKSMMLNTNREEQPSSAAPDDICSYLTANPAFNSKSVLLRRVFFIEEFKKVM